MIHRVYIAANLAAHRTCSSVAVAVAVAVAGAEDAVVDAVVEGAVANIYRVVSGAWLAAVHEVSVVLGEAVGELGSAMLEKVRRRVLRVLRVAIRPEVEGLVEEFVARARSAVAAASIVPEALWQRRRAGLLESRTGWISTQTSAIVCAVKCASIVACQAHEILY